MSKMSCLPQNSWFSLGADPIRLNKGGLKISGGGVHQSKTIMLAELATFLRSYGDVSASARDLIIEQNILGKPTLSARQIALARLQGLYAVYRPVPVASAMFGLWDRDTEGRPMLALLAALARDPLLRDSASAVLPSAQGAQVRWPIIAASFAAQYPERFSPKMLKSLSQNCASSWTQSGHLNGALRKIRVQARPTPAAAAYAALLANICGFGGPALLDSPWMEVLDVPQGERLSLLRQAEAQGYVRVRTAGDMLEIMVRQPLSQTLRMPDLAEL